MKLLSFIICMLITNSMSAFEIEKPDDLYPIDGASEILYSQELDDTPYFLERLSQDKFLLMTLDDNDIELLEYSLSKDTTVLKMEFEYDNGESIENYLIKGNKLLLFTTFATLEALIGKRANGFLDRIVTINLDSYQVEDCRFVFSNYNRDNMEDYEEQNDWKFCSDTIPDETYTIDFEKLNIAPNEYKQMIITFNKDSTVKNYLGIAYSNENKERFIYTGNLDINTLKNTSSINKFDDGKIWTYISYVYLDDESNVYFVGVQNDNEKKIRRIVASKVTPKGVITSNIQDISYTLTDKLNTIGSFELFKNENGKLSLFGYSKHYDDGKWYKDPISAITLLELNLQTLDINYKEKSISIEDGKKLNGDDKILRFNSINKVIETKDGYTLLTETYATTGTTISRNYNANYLFNAHSEDLNLISLDKELDIKWNKHIYRDFEAIRLKMGPIKGTYFDKSNTNSLYLKPEVNGDTLSFTYSTTEPEDEIIRVSFNINTGEKIYQQSIFKNDGTLSYFPGNHLKVGDDEYVGTLNNSNNFIVRYKLFKK